MAQFVLFLSIGFGVTGLYIGFRAYRAYGKVIESAGVATLAQFLGVAGMSGVSASLVFFSSIAIGVTIAENKQIWSLREALALGGGSALLGIAVFLGSMYQVYTTAKLRDLLITRLRTKKKG